MFYFRQPQKGPDSLDRPYCQDVGRILAHGSLVVFKRSRHLPLAFEHAPKIVVGEAVALVALCLERHAQPRNRILRLIQLDEIRSDVVVGIAEFGIQIDGPVAIRNGAFQIPLVGARPSSEGVSLRRGKDVQRLRIKPYRLVDIPAHLVLVGLPHQLHRLLALLIPGHSHLGPQG